MTDREEINMTHDDEATDKASAYGNAAAALKECIAWKRFHSLSPEHSDAPLWAIAAGLFAVAKAIDDKGTPNQSIRDLTATLRAKGVNV